jgi:hypothetical protein
MDEKIKQKLQQIQSLVSECLSAEEGGEYEEEESMEEVEPSGDVAGDKIKMAASMLKRKMGE